MASRVETTLEKFTGFFSPLAGPKSGQKEAAELRFWKTEIRKYIQWYEGELPILYKSPSPKGSDKIKRKILKDSAILTWHKLHQEPKYLQDLGLTTNSFEHTRILDVGGGPMPSSTCFEACELYHLEPLLADYIKVGFPLHYYPTRVRFVVDVSENIPLEDEFFDAIVSVNAIDHVNDIELTSREIRRVLKQNGRLRIHTHYHRATICEPIELNDSIMERLFSWCPGFKKIAQTTTSFSQALPEGESFALWSNFIA
jgi:SAM-dependent methyltransferase